MAKRGRGRKRWAGSGADEDRPLGSKLQEQVAEDLNLAKLMDSLNDFDTAVINASHGLVGFGKDVASQASEIQRAKAAFSELSSQMAFPAAQAAASSISPGLGSLVGGARGFLGNVAATGTAAGELEDASAQMAFQGMPLSKDFQESIFPLLKARRQAVEQARQQSADVTRGEVQGSIGDAVRGGLEAIGFGDVYRMFINGGNARTP